MRLVLAVAAITIGGLVLRLWGIDAYGTWFDEAYHVALVRTPSVGTMLDAVLSNPPSDPLYILLLRPWVGAFGHADAVIRIPSLIAGTLTIPAAAWLGWELTRRRDVALAGAAFVALSPYLLEFSQEAAPYALATLAATAALAAAWRWRRTGVTRDGALFVALGIVAVYSHYVVFAVLALDGVLGTSRWAGAAVPTRRTWLVAHAIVLVAWLPWAAGLLLHWQAATPRATLAHPATLDELLVSLTQYGAGTAAVVEAVRPLQAASAVLGALLLALGWRAGGAPDRRGLRVVPVAAAAIFVIPAAVSAATGAWLFVAHFLVMLLPAVLIVMAAGILELGKRSRVAAAALAAGWLAVSMTGVVLLQLHPPHGNDGIRELAAMLRAQAATIDVILVSPAILEPSLAQELEVDMEADPGRLIGIPSRFDLADIYGPFARPPTDDQLRAATEAASVGRHDIWLVHRPELDPNGVVVSTLRGRYRLVLAQPFEFATLYRFDDRPR